MRAVSPGRAAIQDMDADHGRLYVAMAEKFLDRTDIVAPSSRCVADEWPLRVRAAPERYTLAIESGVSGYFTFILWRANLKGV